MTPTLRIGLAAAALVAVLVTGFTFLRPTSGPGATSTPSPTAAATSTASDAPWGSPLPSTITGRWMGGPRTVSGISTQAGTSLQIDPTTIAISQSNENGNARLSSSVSYRGTTMVAVSTQTAAGCTSGDAGTLRWSLSTGGRVLTLASESDACATRAAAFSGTWWKMDCPEQNDNCLGDLEAGTYASQFVDPYTITGWTPRYGVVEYTVPDGWSNVNDWPNQLRLSRQGAPDEVGMYLFSDVVVSSQEADCPERPDPGIGSTADAITTWLTTVDGLTASTPLPVTIGGLSGSRVDIAMDPAWTATCPYSDGHPVRTLFTDRTDGEGFDWNIGADERMRLFVLDLGNGRATVVDIGAPTEAQFTDLVGDATSIVNTFQFNP